MRNIIKEKKIELIIAAIVILIGMIVMLLIFDWTKMLWTMGGGLVSIVNIVVLFYFSRLDETTNALRSIVGSIIRLVTIGGILLLAFLVSSKEDNNFLWVAISVGIGLTAMPIGVLAGYMPVFKKKDQGSDS